MSGDVPFQRPPSIEASVKEHLNVVHEMREFRVTLDKLSESTVATAIAVTSLAGDIGRLGDAMTADSLTLQRLERRVTSLEGKFDTLLRNQLALMKHLGVSVG